MRLYYMTSDEYGIAAIRDRRLKLSRISQLNDPFELRSMWESLYDLYENHKGLLCFSEGWQSPLMWAHYAQKHTGVCLGFEIRESEVHKVSYEKHLFVPHFPPGPTSLADAESMISQLLSHKFEEWSYEHEWRMYRWLQEPDRLTKLHFVAFDEELTLCEVILGARNRHQPEDFAGLLDPLEGSIDILTAEPDAETFSMREKAGSRRTYGRAGEPKA